MAPQLYLPPAWPTLLHNVLEALNSDASQQALIAGGCLRHMIDAKGKTTIILDVSPDLLQAVQQAARGSRVNKFTASHFSVLRQR